MVSVFRIGGTFVPFDDLDFDISSLASCRKDPKKEETEEGSRLGNECFYAGRCTLFPVCG